MLEMQPQGSSDALSLIAWVLASIGQYVHRRKPAACMPISMHTLQITNQAQAPRAVNKHQLMYIIYGDDAYGIRALSSNGHDVAPLSRRALDLSALPTF